MTVFEILQIVISLLVPITVAIGVYVSLRVRVTKNQIRIEGMKEDITEIKTDVKELKKYLIIK